jgi:ring-1,2-phenylacetyl-CoA epoxidase subunit PaaC
MTEEDPRLALLLAMADDELILGHRHSEWTGWAPHIEEDLAFSSIAQDEIAHARLMYGLAKEFTGRQPDDLALGRRPEEYRNAVLCERPNRDWGYTVARQYLYDRADDVRLRTLVDSSWGELSELAKLMLLEERYHLDHARAWFERVTSGPSLTARERFAQGLSAAVAEAMALFEPLPGEASLVADGILARSNEDLLSEWLEAVGEELESASLDYVLERGATGGEMVPTGSGEMPSAGDRFTVPEVARSDGRWIHQGGFTGAGGRWGRHSDDFVPLWEEMTELYRAHPGAKW